MILTRISEEKYYKSFFEDKKDSKVVWEDIWSIINMQNKKSNNIGQTVFKQYRLEY